MPLELVKLQELNVDLAHKDSTITLDGLIVIDTWVAGSKGGEVIKPSINQTMNNRG